MSVARRTAPSDSSADSIARVLLVYLACLGTAVLLIASVLGVVSPARASEMFAMKPGEAQSGTLLFKSSAGGSKGGDTFAAPLVSTDVVIRVSGMVARATVKQTFRNPMDDWLEGIYVFPLPENAAVDHLRMQVGERSVEGVIREREAARREYSQARRAGQRAALLEQERPNIFTSSVANIGPQDRIVVEIEYQQTLRLDNARYSLRFPMVVGPRYIPGAPVATKTGTGWSPDTTRVSDASRITPPVIKPAPAALAPDPAGKSGERREGSVSLRVELDAGVPLAEVTSAYHKVFLSVSDHRRQTVTLEQGAVVANRDFELTWTPTAESAPRAAWFTEKRGDRHYGLLMILPPTAMTRSARIPREAIFVIDTSGSMSGSSIAQAKEALELAIDRLTPADRFNVVEFNSYARPLFEGARLATATNRAEARGWVRALRAQGGTEIAKALDLALDGREHPDRVRQVVFLTDGAVGNEAELFRLIAAKLGDSRLFTVGIGSAPNSHFMSKAAEAGRGTFTYIGKVEEVRRKMGELFTKLESPALKGVRVDWPAGAAVESWPRRLPDLYAGEPLVLTAALDRLEGTVRVSGRRGDAPWEATLALDEQAAGSGMSVLWARDKIAALTDTMREGGADADVRAKVVAQVIDLALAHHLVTKYTSLVAVDRTPARTLGTVLKSGAVPTALPEGWNYDAVFGSEGELHGELPQGATDSRLHLAIGMLLLLLATLMLLSQRHALPRVRS